jgi:hypothetical protein
VSWTWFFQIMTIIFWVGVVAKAAFGKGSERFGDGKKPTQCGRACANRHTYGRDCSLS